MGAILLALLAVASPASRPVDAHADTLEFTPSSRALHLHGHAVLHSEGLLLHADDLDYDPDADTADAAGHVYFTSGTLTGTADALKLDLDESSGSFEGATLYQKAHVSAADLARADSPQRLRLLGENVLTLRTDLIHRLEPKVFDAEGVYLTPCDCRADGWLTEPPSWSIRARRAHIAQGESARLAWARLYIKDVPALPVPLLVLPLSNRQTGFLLPRPNYTARNGLQLEEPFFWAINRSADATITPGYFFGAAGGGMRGPRLDTEMRYVPSDGTHGRITFALVDDRNQDRGFRGELGVNHVQDLGHGFSDRVDAAAISDQQYFQQVTADVVAQQLDYLRSDARVDHRGDSTDVFVAGSYYQNLNGAKTPPSLTQGLNLYPLVGAHDVNAFTFQRLPAAGFSLAETAVGPLRVRLDADAVRYAPLEARHDLVCPQATLALPHDATAQSACALTASREVSERAGVAPTVRAPILLGRFAELAPYAMLRADAWHLDAVNGDDGRARGLAMVGATLQSDVARVFTFADGVRWRHVVTPVAELRSIPWTAGSAPDVANDEVDAPIGTVQPAQVAGEAPAVQPLQGLVALRTRIDRRQGDAVSEPVRAELGQGYDFAHQTPGDSFGDLALQLGPASASGAARYNFEQRRWVSVAANAGYTAPGGSSLGVGYARLRGTLSDPLRAGLFDLVGPAAALAPGQDPDALAERLDLSGHYKPTVALGLDASVSYLPHAHALTAFGGAPDFAPIQRLLNYAVGVSYGSPCDCWSLKLNALFQPAGNARPFVPSAFFFVLDAHRLGGNLGG